MIKHLKHFKPDALIKKPNFRKYAVKFEMKLLHGISSLSILTIIKKHGDEGIYGNEIIRELNSETDSMLILEEGTLYPLLRKLVEKNLIIMKQKKDSVNRRTRNYYSMTSDGIDTLNHLSGFFSKLVEAIGPMLNLNIEFDHEKFIYCPNCSNRIDLTEEEVRFCRVCGFSVKDHVHNKHGGNKQ